MSGEWIGHLFVGRLCHPFRVTRYQLNLVSESELGEQPHQADVTLHLHRDEVFVGVGLEDTPAIGMKLPCFFDVRVTSEHVEELWLDFGSVHVLVVS